MATRRWVEITAVAVLALVFGLSALAWTAEQHPHIRVTLRDLQHAERQLQQAAHDYGGHRIKAMELIRQAQAELREGLTYDRQHEEGGKKQPSKGGAGTSPTPSK